MTTAVMNKKRKQRPIRIQLFRNYFILIFFIIVFITAIMTTVFYRRLAISSIQEVSYRLSAISRDINSNIVSIIAASESVKTDPKLMEILSQRPFDETPIEHIADRVQNILDSSGQDSEIDKIILLDKNLTVLDPMYNRYIYQEGILGNKDFGTFLSGKFLYYISSPGTFPIDMKTTYDQDNLSLSFYQRILDENYWILGYLIAIIRRDALFSQVRIEQLKETFSGITIVDQDNSLIYHEGQAFETDTSSLTGFSQETPNASITHLSGDKYVLLKEPISGVNWYIAGIIPYSFLVRDLNFTLILIFLTGGLFIIIALLLSRTLAKSITRPLETVSAAMHQYDEQKLLDPIDIKTEQQEMQYLISIYNKMVNRIHKSIQNIYSEQEQKKEAELKSLQYELDFLQAQINPHFIHNTLNAIGYQAEKSGNTQVYESLRSFNRLLRAAMSGTEDLIPLSEEITLIQNYINILSLRYGKDIGISYPHKEDMYIQKTGTDQQKEPLLIPKMILQPIVENAVFHGIESSQWAGCIDISLEQHDKDTIIHIKDDGPGMSKEKIQEILQEDHRSTFNRIGIFNVDERLKIFYGDEYGIDITCPESGGTCISIKIPNLGEQADV